MAVYHIATPCLSTLVQSYSVPVAYGSSRGLKKSTADNSTYPTIAIAQF